MAYTSLLQWTAPKLHKQTTETEDFTTNYVANPTYITAAAPHGLSAGDLVEFVEGTTLQTPLAENKIYSVFAVINTTVFEVSLNGTSAITLTSNGTNDSTYKAYTTSVTLENFNVTLDAPENRVFWHESIVNNHREVVNTDKMHWALEFRLNLFKEATLSTRRADFDELFGYLYTDVYVSRCNIDGSASVVIRDSSGDPVNFVMDKFETSVLAQSNFEENLIIGLKSKDPIDMSATV